MTNPKANDSRPRCFWATDPLCRLYHDEEWGVPQHEDRPLFEMLMLEGAQAGLSWLTILKRREGYRRAFCDFNVEQVAKLGERDVQRLLKDPSIIRNQLKIRGAIANARAFMDVQEEFGSFDAYSWRFVNGKPVMNKRRSLGAVPATTRASDAFSKDLKSRGFKFVGSTIMYAHMQAVGMVNDHLVTCFRYQESRESV